MSAPERPVLNTEWIEKVREWIRAADAAAHDPEVTACPFPVWNQNLWRGTEATGDLAIYMPYRPECGAAFCMAGYVSEKSGGEWIGPADTRIYAGAEDFEFFGIPNDELWYDGPFERQGDRWIMSAAHRAQRVMGLTDLEVEFLFYAETDLEEVERRLDVILETHPR